MKKIPLLDIDVRYFRYLWRYTPQLVLTLATMIGVALLDIAAPWPLKYIIDNVIGGQAFSDPLGKAVAASFGDDPRVLAAFFGSMIVVLTALDGVFTFTYGYLQGVIQARLTFRLRSDAFAHLQTLSLQFHDRSRTGEVITRVTNDAGRVMEALVGNTSEVVVNVLKFAGLAAIMLFVSWHFSIIALAYAPLLLFLFGAFRRNIKLWAKAVRAEEGHLFSVTQETVSAIRVVQAFGREADEQRRFEQHGVARMQAEMRSARWEAAFEPIVDVIKAAGTVAVLWYGVAEILGGQLTVGELLVFLAYLATFYAPLKRFSKLALMIQQAGVSGDRLADLLDNDLVIHEEPAARGLARARGGIGFERVSFGYSANQVVLQDVSFTSGTGQKIAIVGHTGAGKTTLANLMMRFYDVSAGRITLDGIDIRQIRLRDLRRQFALVPQEPILFAASIGDNIAYGKPQASMGEIIAAARAANAHNFISRLPEGYASAIGERGATLSGGQRQRIAIARAILYDAPILILDEPTAALDSESEREVLRALEHLMQGRTTFVIAHRLSTVRDADWILAMDNGAIVEQGQHDELMARGGTYSRLVRLQFAPSLEGVSVDFELAAN